MQTSTATINLLPSAINNLEYLQLHSATIKWCKSNGNYVTLFCEVLPSKVIRIALTELLQHLPNTTFIRIHKSYIVNVNYIKNLRATTLTIDGKKLPIGRTYQKTTREYLKVQTSH
jgi:DNA-binding LytR/AlgR family response regulator